MPLKGVDQLADFQLGQKTLLNGIAIVFNLACHSLPLRHVLDFKVRHKQPVSPVALTDTACSELYNNLCYTRFLKRIP